MSFNDETHATHEEKEFDDLNDYHLLLKYVDELASHKLGYPVSLLTYLGMIDNTILGILPHSLANVLLNNVGDPFKDSETSLLEVKKHERSIIGILEKFYGMNEGQARGYVTTGGTEGNFASLWWSKRYLINSALSNLIAIDNKIKLQTNEVQELEAELARIPFSDLPTRVTRLQRIIELNKLMTTNRNIVQQLLTPTVFYSQGHTHYSVAKIAEILKLNTRPVEANEDGSINLANLEREILLNMGAHPNSPLIVIANIGTTITGAIDDVPKIRELLDRFNDKVHSTIHLDGALTGFVMPIVKPFGDIHNYFDDIGANTLAVSAHKYPGLSQPCGIVLARKEFFDRAFEKSERSIEYVGNILDVTITGSRSGLNVLMFYHALYSLDLHKNTDKLTMMVKNNLANARYLYEQLVTIFGEDQVKYRYHFNVSFPKPSMGLAKKYQLMLSGNMATICVLTNVTKTLIDTFILELKLDKETTMLTTTDYKITSLTAEHLNSTVRLFTRSFCDSEPITRHLGLQYAEYEPFAREVVLKAIKDGLSRIAIDKQNHVIACCIAEDMSDPFIPKLAHYPKLKPIFAILNQLSKRFLEEKVFTRGKIAHVWIAAVDPEHRGKKLSIAIDKATSDLLARKGYDYVYAEFTNELSEKIVNQYNIYKRLNRIEYDSFVVDGGIRPFAGVTGGAASYVIVIRPGIKLDQLDQAYQVEEKY